MRMYFDHIINALVLCTDLGILWLIWDDRTRRQKARNTRKFNKILKSIGLK